MTYLKQNELRELTDDRSLHARHELASPQVIDSFLNPQGKCHLVGTHYNNQMHSREIYTSSICNSETEMFNSVCVIKGGSQMSIPFFVSVLTLPFMQKPKIHYNFRATTETFQKTSSAVVLEKPSMNNALLMQ